jgi:HEAT repeat protein
MLEDPDAVVRGGAAGELDHLGAKAAAAAAELERALADQDAHVRERAASALTRIGRPER